MVINMISCIVAITLAIAATIFNKVYHPTRRELRRILGFKNEELSRSELWDRINLIISNNNGRKIIRNGYHIFIRPYNANKNNEQTATIYCGNNITLAVGRRFDLKLGRVRNICDVTFSENTDSYIHMIRAWGTMNDVSRLLGSRKIPVQENRKVIIKRYRDYILERIL